jgi:anaerobic selenocysteine-containing dehydrogenase
VRSPASALQQLMDAQRAGPGQRQGPLHPAHSSRRSDRVGVRDGTVARVSSEAGALDVPVEVTDEMMRGVVSLPHGWGHNLDGVRLAVAREHAGVNNNLLAPGHLVDEISGNAVVNGIPVEVVPA